MKNAKHSWKYHGNFCSAVCSNGVIAMCYQQPLCFIFIFTGLGSSGYGKLFLGFLHGEKKVGKCCCRGNKMAVYSELNKTT